MFVRLVLGQAGDREVLRGEWERRRRELASAGADWLSSTGGVTADGRAVVGTWFTSRTKSSATSEMRGFESPPRVLDTEDVSIQDVGDLSRARFVQVMHAAVADRARFEAVEDRIGVEFVRFRPDYLGGYRLWFPGASLVAVDYFSSEAEARAGENNPMPADLAAGFEEWQSLVGAPEWLDLTDPWLAWPE